MGSPRYHRITQKSAGGGCRSPVYCVWQIIPDPRPGTAAHAVQNGMPAYERRRCHLAVLMVTTRMFVPLVTPMAR